MASGLGFKGVEGMGVARGFRVRLQGSSLSVTCDPCLLSKDFDCEEKGPKPSDRFRLFR